MSDYHGDSLYRIEYLPSLLIPIILGILDSAVRDWNIVFPLVGWLLMAIGMNLMNDAIDQDRLTGLSVKSLLILSAVSTGTGLYLALSYNFLYALIFIFLVTIYNLKLKKIPLINLLISVVTYPILGYLAFVVHPKILTLIILILGAFFAELVHNIADRDATFRYLKNKTIILTTILGVALFLSSIYIAIKVNSFWLPLPLITGVGLYGVIHNRNKLEKWPEMKKLGTEVFKFATIYLSVFLFK